MDWAAISSTINQATFKAPIVSGEFALDAWVVWVKTMMELDLSISELARFQADVYSRDCAYVDDLNYEMDLAQDAEWQR